MIANYGRGVKKIPDQPDLESKKRNLPAPLYYLKQIIPGKGLMVELHRQYCYKTPSKKICTLRLFSIGQDLFSHSRGR